jgi:hypothetical protein
MGYPIVPFFLLFSAFFILDFDDKYHLTEVSIIANIKNMKYTIEYFHARVKDEIEVWPDGILADYARLVELLMEFGPNRKRMKEVRNG